MNCSFTSFITCSLNKVRTGVLLGTWIKTSRSDVQSRTRQRGCLSALKELEQLRQSAERLLLPLHLATCPPHRAHLPSSGAWGHQHDGHPPQTCSPLGAAGVGAGGAFFTGVPESPRLRALTAPAHALAPPTAHGPIVCDAGRRLRGAVAVVANVAGVAFALTTVTLAVT